MEASQNGKYLFALSFFSVCVSLKKQVNIQFGFISLFKVVNFFWYFFDQLGHIYFFELRISSRASLFTACCLRVCNLRPLSLDVSDIQFK